MDKSTLYHKGKQGEIRVWSVWSEQDLIKTEYGLLNGELQVSTKRATPKNTGRKNATTAEEQADLEAKALYKFKLDRKYSKTIENAQEPLLLPMLAKDAINKIKFPAYIQPKLDGVRCLAFWEDGKIKLISRAGKEWTVPKHINEQLSQLLPVGCILDGELYIHGKSCQTITSYVKKWRPVETTTVEYHVYDAPGILNGHSLIDDATFEERLDFIRFLDAGGEMGKGRENWPNIKFVETHKVETINDVKSYEQKMLSMGYEGAIVRNVDGVYLYGYRSDDLIKIKTFQDAEFEAIHCKEGQGKFEGCAIFTCVNDINDLRFDCVLATTMEEKAEMFANKDKYIGKLLTVKFFDRTNDGLPRFPVGLRFRPEEDLPG